MNKKWNYLLLIVIASAMLQSCGMYNTLFPKRKDNYINYNLLFADPEANNALRNKAPEQVAGLDSKIRIITINKLTNDTIVEWVDPIEITKGKKLVIPKKENTAPVFETEFTLVTKESEILQPRKAIVFVQTDGGTMFQARNDTLFVNTSSNKMESVLLTMLGRNLPETNVVIDTKIKTEEKQNSKKNNLLKGLIKNKKNKQPEQIANPTPDTTSATLPDDVNAPPTQLLSNTNTIVGDLNFDTDVNVTIITDEDTLINFLKSQAKQWQSFKCKAKVKLKTNDDNKSFNTNFRMVKDKQTWASINLLGIGELARAYATPDSIAVMDKWKDKFYNYATNDLQQLIGMPIPYTSLQDYIIGNAPITQGTQYLGKKSDLGMAIKIIKPGLSCVLTYNADSTLKTIIIIGNSNGKSFSIKNSLSEYEQTTNGKISTKRSIYILENGQETIINLDFSKIEFDQQLDFPFSIPAHFKNGNKEKLNKP
jgi:hypothetical protein